MTNKLQQLGEYWKNAKYGDATLPTATGRPTVEYINSVGEALLELLEKIDSIEKKFEKLL